MNNFCFVFVSPRKNFEPAESNIDNTLPITVRRLFQTAGTLSIDFCRFTSPVLTFPVKAAA